MKSARILSWSLIGIAAMAVLACHAPTPPDAVVRLKQVFADRTPVADDDNGFLDAHGFSAPAGMDPHELGLRRLAWLEKSKVDPKGAGPDPGEPALDFKMQRSQTMTQVIGACSGGTARACANALERVKPDVPLSDIEPLLLARYDVLSGRRGWFESGFSQASNPVPPYAGILDAQRILLIRLRLAAVAGDTAKIHATLSRDLAFWRGLLESSDTLLSKMIAIAAIRQHFLFASYLLRGLPAERVMEAIPAEWREELSEEERSLLRVMAGELTWVETLLQAQELKNETLDDDEVAPLNPVERLFSHLSGPTDPQPTLGEVADTLLSVAESFKVPLNRYEAVAAKLKHEFESSGALFRYEHYGLRVGSVEAMRRAALLTAELRSQSVPADQVAQRLKDSALRNPFNEQPFGWDATDRAVVYIGLEKNKWTRQAYPY